MMTNLEMLKEMAELQYKYDEDVYKVHDCDFDRNKCYCALVDELGELNHELKVEWCWWERTQKPVNKTKVLEKLADIWRVALSMYNHNVYRYLDIEKTFLMINMNKLYCEVLRDIVNDNRYLIKNMIELSYILGFTFEEVYVAYKFKNKVNYERLESGY